MDSLSHKQSQAQSQAESQVQEEAQKEEGLERSTILVYVTAHIVTWLHLITTLLAFTMTINTVMYAWRVEVSSMACWEHIGGSQYSDASGHLYTSNKKT